MKFFQAVIIAALAASSAATKESVASPTTAIEHELAEYERQLADGVSLHLYLDISVERL